MFRGFRPARALALLILTGLLIGVPWLVVSVVGLPFPTPSQLGAAWRERRVPGELVLRVGTSVFVVLWAWFASTALAELAQVRRARRVGAAAVPPVAPGPAGWVRMLVRVVAISSLSATATLGGFLPMLRSAGAGTVRVSSVHVDVAGGGLAGRLFAPVATPTTRTTPSSTNAAATVHVAVGRETPYSVANSYGRPELRQAIIDLNVGRSTPDGGTWTSGVFPAGMEVALPTGVSSAGGANEPVPAAATASEGPSSAVSFASGLGTALLLSAGAVSLLEARRRRQWRAAGVGARLSAPSLLETRTEVLLRSLTAPERVARLDIAVRAAAVDLVDQDAGVMAAVLGDTGEVCLYLRGRATPAAMHWHAEGDGSVWRLGAEVTLADLAPAARRVAQPCPAMVHLGGSEGGGEVFVDLEAVGALSVLSPWSTDVLRAVACSLAVSPFMESARVFPVGLGEQWPGAESCEPADSLDAALDAAVMAIGSVPTFAAPTFRLRASGAGGEAWEPAVVVATGEDVSAAIANTVHTVGAGRGLAVVVDTVGLRDGWCLRHDGDRHVLQPLGLVVQPVGVTEGDVAGVQAVLAAANEPPVIHAPVVPIGGPSAAPFVEPEWSVMVRVLGQVDVVSPGGESADFERSKSLELVVWLSQHRERPTRTAARTALWDLDVRDATFANVVSDARRGLARSVAPPEGEEWIARTLTEDLPLHVGVCTDAELLAARVSHARGLAAADAIEVLRPGVELLGGLPFAGTSYLWTDAEGITSSLVLLATSAAIELATHYLHLGDIDGVFWATGQGLKVLAGHEELIALRMRAHARRGDLAGVRSEWESYERALAADPWAAAEPAPKLVALRRDLLTAHRSSERALA